MARGILVSWLGMEPTPPALVAQSGNHWTTSLRLIVLRIMVKNLPTNQETWVPFLGREDPLEKGMAIHSSIPAWRIPWTEEPGEIQTTGCEESDTTEQLTFSLFPQPKGPSP